MPAGGARLRMPEKRCSGLSSSARAWGPPTPRGAAGLRSIFRAIATASSERPPPGRHAHRGTLTRCALEAGSTCRIAGACASGTRAAGGNRAEQECRGESLQCVRVVVKQLERFMPPDTCRSNQLLLAAQATGQRRGGRFPPRSAGGGEPVGRARLERIQKEIGLRKLSNGALHHGHGTSNAAPPCAPV